MSSAHIQTAADILTRTCHEAALASGWWTDENGNLKAYNTPEKLCLVHSEISEAMEGFRTDALTSTCLIVATTKSNSPTP